MKRREPNDRDYEAARRVLSRNPPAAPEDFERELQRLAEARAKVGAKLFLLYCGLREPRDRPEQWAKDHWNGVLSAEKYEQLMKEYTARPCDEEMLNTLFEGLERRLRYYSTFLQRVSALASRKLRYPQVLASERRIDRILKKMMGTFGLFDAEIDTAAEFLREARLDHQLGLAKAGEFSCTTAMRVVVQATLSAQELWKACRKTATRSRTTHRYLYAAEAAKLFMNQVRQTLPSPQIVSTLLEQEHVIGLRALRKAQTTEATTNEQNLTAATVNVSIRGETVNLHASDAKPGEGAGDAEATSSAPLMAVTRWSELALGIDEHRHVWGLTPAPARGAPFSRSKAVQLPLRGRRWSTLLKLFAESASGQRVRRIDLEQAFGFLPPGPRSEGDRRARRDAVESDLVANLQPQPSPAHDQLNQLLTDIRRKLRKLVLGPSSKGHNCLEVDGEDVVSRFVVGYLVQDEQGQLRFGTTSAP